jgi:RNA polymerase sigma factor (sigma-70 family)
VTDTRRVAGRIGGLEVLAPLSRDDERRLYPVILEGRRAEAELARVASRDERRSRQLLRARHDGQEAESTLLRATFGLVKARVNERGYRWRDEDLELAGVEGLVNALSRFDPDQGNRFSTYANYWITKLVNEAVQQRAGLSDAEMRRVLAVEKLQRARPERPLTAREVVGELGVSLSSAREAIHMARDLAHRREESIAIDELESSSAHRPDDAPAWVIDELRRITGEDFDAFWQHTFHTTSLSELARARGVSRQALTKRLERCRRAVRESPEAERLMRWLDEQ